MSSESFMALYLVLWSAGRETLAGAIISPQRP